MSAPVTEEEIGAVTDIYVQYGRPLGASGVLLATAVITEANFERTKIVLEEMARRGLLRVKHRASRPDHDDIFELPRD